MYPSPIFFHTEWQFFQSPPLSLLHSHLMALPWDTPLNCHPVSLSRSLSSYQMSPSTWSHPHGEWRQSNGTCQMKAVLPQGPRCQGMTVSMIVPHHSMWEAQSGVFYCIIKQLVKGLIQSLMHSRYLINTSHMKTVMKLVSMSSALEGTGIGKKS